MDSSTQLAPNWPTRVLIVNPYGAGGKYNGPTLFADRLFHAVKTAQSSVDISLVYGGERTRPPSWASRVKRLGGTGRLGLVGQAVWAIRVSVQIFSRRSRFDYIHFQSAYLFNLFGAAAARVSGVAYGVLPTSEKGDLNQQGRASRWWVLRRLRRYAIGGASVGWALSSGIGDELAAWSMPRSRISPIGNVVDTDLFQPLVQSGVAGRSAVFVGRLGSRKQPDLLLQAMALLRRKRVEASAVFVGPYEDGAYRKYFEALIKRLELRDFVTVVEYVENVVPYLQQGSVFVLPSRQEGLPAALAEAMSCGLPAVVTDVGQMGEVVRAAQCGEVVGESAPEIAEAVERYLLQPDAGMMFGQRGRAYAQQHFSSGAIAKRFVERLQCLPKVGDHS